MTKRAASGHDKLRLARRLLRSANSAAELRAAQAVLFIDEHGLSLRQAALMLGCSAATVSRLRQRFAVTPGYESLGESQWGGRRRENLRPQQERQLLRDLAGAGGGQLQVAKLHRDYVALLGRPVPDSTIYRMLRRHGWRRSGRGRYRPAEPAS